MRNLVIHFKMEGVLKMTKIFVVGATGLIGTKLTKRLLEEGYDVAGLTRSQQGKAKLEDQGVTGLMVTYLKLIQLKLRLLVTNQMLLLMK